MNVNDIHSTALRRTYTSIANYPLNATAMIDLNYVYHDVCSEVRNKNELYFYIRQTLPTVAYENKYLLGVPTSSVVSMQKLLSVAIKYQQSQYDAFQPNTQYSAGDYILHTGLTYIARQDFTSGAVFNIANWKQVYVGYVSCKEVAMTPQNIEIYNTGLDMSYPQQINLSIPANPIYMFGQDRDNITSLRNALYIYPYPTSSILEGIIIEGVRTDIDLTTTTPEAEIMIERNYHNVLVEGYMWLIYQQQGKIEEAQAQKQMYEIAKRQMIDEIGDRTLTPNYVDLPNLSSLE